MKTLAQDSGQVLAYGFVFASGLAGWIGYGGWNGLGWTVLGLMGAFVIGGAYRARR